MTTPDYWRIHLAADAYEAANFNAVPWRDVQRRAAPVVARVDHYPNRTVVTFEATGYVVAVAQWLPGAGGRGSGRWEVYGPDCDPGDYHTTADAIGALYGFVLENIEKGIKP